MASEMEQELLLGFEEEARGYLPFIRDGITDYFQGNRHSELFDDALRYSHTIKGAAAMLELDGLSQIARRLNIALQALRAQGDPSQVMFKEIIRRHVAIIEAYLDTLMEKIQHGVSLDTIDDEAFVAAVEMLYWPDESKVTPAERKALDATRNLSTGPLPELVGVFQEEAEEHLQNIAQQVGRLEGNPADEYALLEIRRSVHTLKGASASMGLRAITRLTHSMEDLFDKIVTEKEPLSQKISQLLQDSTDVLNVLIEGEVEGLDDETAATMCASLIEQYEALLKTPPESSVFATPATDWDITQEALPSPSFVDDHLTLKRKDERKPGTRPLPDIAHILATSTGNDLQAPTINAAENDEIVEAATQPEIEFEPGDIEVIPKKSESKKPIPTGDLPTRPIADPVQEMLDAEAALDVAPPNIAFAELAELEAAYLASQAREKAEAAAGAEIEAEAEPVVDEAMEAAASQQSPDIIEADLAGVTPVYEAPDSANLPITISPTFALELSNLFKIGDRGESLNGVEDRGQTVVRVPIDRLDELVRLMSEFIVSRSTLEQRLGQLRRLSSELNPSIERLRRLTGRMDTEFEAQTLLDSGSSPQRDEDRASNYFADSLVNFDALEMDHYTEFHLLSREFAETSTDIRTVGYELETLLAQFDNTIEQQERLTSNLQERLLNTRLVPFGTLTNRLLRVVRSVSQSQDKEVEFTISGEDVQVDKGALAQLADPLLHLLRNAVDHGIESDEERLAAGKSQKASIHIKVYQEGNQVIIEVQDDGRGLNLDKIRQRAIQKDLCGPTVAAALSRRDLYNLLFVPGFTTRETVTEVSGRGVGLDIVKAYINRLQATIAVASEDGNGSRFVIRLPMTLAVMRAMTVMAHNERFAIPLADVTRVVQISQQDIKIQGGQKVVAIGNRTYPAIILGEALRLPAQPDQVAEYLPALFVNRDGVETAIIIDKLLPEQEIVVKSLGNHLRHVRGIAGATLLGDGQIVLIVNTADLDAKIIINNPAATGLITDEVPSNTLQVMIVDDSVSVRRINERMVSNAGWEPLIARDGLEALELIQSGLHQPDIILLDIEMPRMDGYELTSTLRSMDNYSDLPIIMITSRSSQKHQQKAAEVGATAYLVKPYEEEHLRSMIEKLTKRAGRPQAV